MNTSLIENSSQSQEHHYLKYGWKKKKKVNQTKKKDKIIKNKKDSFSAKLKAPISNTNPINIKLQM